MVEEKNTKNREFILVLDFGSQYSKLISRRIREIGVFSELLSANTDASILSRSKVKGIVLSGGPAAVKDKEALKLPDWVLSSGLPVLGICYGMQLLAQALGGKVTVNSTSEYGIAELNSVQNCKLMDGIDSKTQVWMSHGDSVEVLPQGFTCFASTSSVPVAGMHNSAGVYGVQFHPEVSHTSGGMQLLKNFVINECGCEGNWTMGDFVKTAITDIRQQVGKQQVICAVSGGVDSTVTAALLQQAIGEQLRCIFVDNGLLREGEKERVKARLVKLGINLTTIDASQRFLKVLKGVTDPEQKRKKIGEMFIRIFDEEASKMGEISFLAQGTLYSDVIESQTHKDGPADKIKSHHNVGGLPEDMKLELVEPLRYLFKDEVRKLGLQLGIDREYIFRHPFPGPGIAIRIIGGITEEKIEIVRKSDTILVEEIRNAGLYNNMWQAFTVLTGVKTVGVMGDSRTYNYVVAIRAVESHDAMTANWYYLPHDLLSKISSRIVNEVKQVSRVVYDVTNKPPGTIEWE